MKNLKVWFITGTSKGMGLYLTRHLLSLGHQVVATSRNIDALKAEQANHPDALLPLELDITSDEAVHDAVQKAIERFGRIDLVVNNAGYSLVGSLEEMTDREFRESMEVNLFGTVNVIRHVMPHLRGQQSGHIINISSNAGYVGYPNASSYNAAKFGIIGLTEALAKETAQLGIKATVVAPGQFRTEFMNSLKYVQNRIDVYGVDEAEQMWAQHSGKQQGDPHKLVRILADIAEIDNPPLHLLLGPDTYKMVMNARKEEAAEFEQWKSVTLSTDFNEA